jgi:hypothetical protein
MDALNGLFLAGAATALVPIIIHLVQRRRVQEVVFGSLRFLRKTSHRVVHRRRFEEILLVILRALALAVLAFAFARPFFRKPREGRVEGETFLGEEAALVLIDNSYSMRAEGRLERAKEQALKFLREVDPAAKVGVATYSSQFDQLCPIGSQAAQAEEAVKSIEPSWRGTKLDLALKQANRVLTRAGRSEEHRRIVLTGDFQDSSWENRGDWKLAPGIELTIRNVAKKPVPNVLIGRMAVPRLVVAGGFVEVISAVIRNLTDEPLNDARVTFHVNGEVKGTRSVNIRSGEEAPVRFRHTFTKPGDVVGSIAVEADDELPHDNVAHFCVHVTPRVHVLLVNADRSEKMVLNDGLFVKTALAPNIEDVVSPFEVREVAPEEMKPGDLDGTDVVLFVNVATLPAAMTRIPSDKQGEDDAEFHSPLGAFVAGGGGLGFVCGAKVAPDEFNRTFRGLAPSRLSRLAMAQGDPPVVINQADLRHEIFTEFAQPHSGDLSLAEFSQYFLVTDSLLAQVPARFSDKDAHPALLERVFGQEAANENAAGETTSSGGKSDEDGKTLRPKGKSILFVSSLDLEWNNLCLKSVFVPFVHQLTKRLCARRTGSVRNFAVGDDVTYHLPKKLAEAKLRRKADAAARARADGSLPKRRTPIPPKQEKTPKSSTPGRVEAAKPDGSGKGEEDQWEEPVALKARSVGGASAVHFSPEKPGIYELTYDDGSARFAVNLDPKEPDLRALDTKLLLTTVQKGPMLEGKPAAGAVSVAAKSTARERIESRQKLWRYLLLVVLVALCGEMALAARIGRA